MKQGEGAYYVRDYPSQTWHVGDPREGSGVSIPKTVGPTEPDPETGRRGDRDRSPLLMICGRSIDAEHDTFRFADDKTSVAEPIHPLCEDCQHEWEGRWPGVEIGIIP